MRRRNNGMTLLEVVIIIVILGTIVVVLLPTCGRCGASRRASCANNLKQFGLSLKMYANESEGEVYPPMQVEVTHPDHPNPSKWNSFTYTFAPRMRAIYPEYFNDYKVAICLRDPNHRSVHRDDLSCVAYDNSWDEGSTDPEVTEGCMDEIGDSYVYLNWVFDKLEATDPFTSNVPAPFENSWTEIDQYIDFESYPSVSKEPFWFPTQLAATLTAAQNRSWNAMDDAYTDADDGHRRFIEPWDGDIELDATVIDGFDSDVHYGNGKTNLVRHLREGVERFLVTDIDNPGHTAKAQSTIAVMMDYPVVNPMGYTHQPGGANVLFMDGHVEFIRHNENAPVNRGVGHIIRPIMKHDFREGSQNGTK